MNYRHGYHAGGFADVLKHIVLCGLLETLKKKPAPFCYIDTHAGPGCYDLFSPFAAKGKDYLNGIEKVIQAEKPPPLVRQYIYYIHQINNKLTGSKFSSLRYYPGSPLLAQNIMRPQDRLVFCELHPEEYQALKTTFLYNHQANVHHMDGFLGIKAHLPPKERRGLILIDPPYENPDEFTRIAKAIPLALRRFETGTYAIWYPIKEKNQTDRFLRTLNTQIDRKILIVEIKLFPELPNHLNGCGMAIINPPWQFDVTMEENLPWLWKALTINNQGGYSTYFLKKALK